MIYTHADYDDAVLMWATTSYAEMGFDQRYERDYNIFNPATRVSNRIIRSIQLTSTIPTAPSILSIATIQEIPQIPSTNTARTIRSIR